ncbi:PREDICTED: histone-lysine N-methyltransferase, H3 lysine-79 specific [Camelina sativa]|uniref:Histone-lysine N-methyltransferase, H3 lysine-79 specific n=1 Tax=Camelina sativa TaxID=90675 RepID=A0ABM0VWS0_CAMSA|nr:PREDICTED: histone-lysine N-methyltransferase, H3 lysine-79 specific [Camelina sativa]
MSLRIGVSMEMRYPFQSIRAPIRCACSIYWNLKEPLSLRITKSLASLNSIRGLELKSVGSSLRNVFESHSREVNVFEVKAMDKDTEADGDRKVIKEEERRRKIGLANKGKVPWNKGRKHTEDTRRRIKQRTIEALRNPKVRKKMSDHQQPHSDETKEKIRASVKQVWAERSRSKRLKEKFTSLWSENIAEAARKGGSGEVELEWDSYERIKQEFLSEQLQLAEEKARAKEQTKMIAKQAAQARTEKMRRAAERKKEREEKDRREGKIRKPRQKRENPTIASRSKLKKRLTKIRKKKASLGKIAVGTDRVVSVAAKLEKLDLELIRKERTRGDISLADQIQAAKNLRGNDVLSRFGLFFAMSSIDFD